MKSILENANWRRLNGAKILKPVYDAVEETIAAELAAGHELKICIGTDSQRYGHEFEFATVILFLRKGHGGFMFINNDKLKSRPKLKERMLLEATRSIEIAYHLCELFDKYGTELEVHADINTNPRFASNTSLKEAMGYILGMGFTFKAKPEAYAASCCANKVV